MALLGSLLTACWTGIRAQRYTQARADVRDAHSKLTKARKARAPLRRAAVAGWLVLAAVAALAFIVLVNLSAR